MTFRNIDRAVDQLNDLQDDIEGECSRTTAEAMRRGILKVAKANYKWSYCAIQACDERRIGTLLGEGLEQIDVAVGLSSRKP